MNIGRMWIFSLVIFVAVIGAWRITHVRRSAAKPEERGTAIPVAVTTVKRASIEDFLQLTGDIRGMNEAKAYPKVPGRLAQKVRDIGDAVKRDEVVATVDRNEPAMKFALSEVTSPLGGVITRYFLTIGEAVSPATPICEVAELSPVKVVVHIIEKDLVRIRQGLAARFTVDGYPSKVFQGSISKISESLDSATRSADVEILSENADGRLKPGMFARVNIVLAKREGALIIPRKALREAGGETSVFIIKENKAVFCPVQVGIIEAERVEIVKGISAGQQVVTIGWQNVTEGKVVNVVEDENLK